MHPGSCLSRRLVCCTSCAWALWSAWESSARCVPTSRSSPCRHPCPVRIAELASIASNSCIGHPSLLYQAAGCVRHATSATMAACSACKLLSLMHRAFPCLAILSVKSSAGPDCSIMSRSGGCWSVWRAWPAGRHQWLWQQWPWSACVWWWACWGSCQWRPCRPYASRRRPSLCARMPACAPRYAP